MPRFGLSQSHARVTLEVGGRRFLFDRFDPGSASVPTSTYTPGGGRGAIALAGLAADTRELTLTRTWQRERDTEDVRWLRGKISAECSVADQRLDGDGNPTGKPDIYTGLITGVGTGSTDASSAEPRELTVTVVSDGVVG